MPLDASDRHLPVAAWRPSFVHRLISVLVEVLRSHRVRMAGALVFLELVAVQEPFATTLLVTLHWLVAALSFPCSFQDLWCWLSREYCPWSGVLCSREYYGPEYLGREYYLSGFARFSHGNHINLAG